MYTGPQTRVPQAACGPLMGTCAARDLYHKLEKVLKLAFSAWVVLPHFNKKGAQIKLF